MWRVRAGCAFGAVIALAASGCGGGIVDRLRGARLFTETCKTGPVERLRSDRLAYAGVVRSHATALRRPGGAVLYRFGTLNANGHVTVLGVLAERRSRDCRRWYHVQLPLRPNGVTGWVRASELELLRVRTRIVVDLSARRLVLWREGKPVLRTTVGIGAPATPTPTGRFYVNQRIRTLDSGGPFGPGAVGFSAFSDVLTTWAQGGPVAIHGTNRPETIGVPASNGCLRARNDVLRRLFALAVPGTPVVVRP